MTDAGARGSVTVAGTTRLILPAFAFVLLAATSLTARATEWFVQSGGSGVAFVPQFLTITAGDTVTFLNRGGYHNVVADDGRFRCAHGCDNDGNGGSGNPSSTFWTASVAFPTAGVVGYFCEPHGAPGSGMYGTITVLAPPKPPEPAPLGGLRAGLALCSLLIGAALVEWQRRVRRARAKPPPARAGEG